MNTSFFPRQLPLALFAISFLLSFALTGAVLAQEGWQTATVLVRASKSEQQVQQEQQLQKSLEELQAKAMEQQAALQKGVQEETAPIITLDGINIHVGALNQHGTQIKELKQKIAQNTRMAERCKRALEAGQAACDELIWTLNQGGGLQAGNENDSASAAISEALAGLQIESAETSQQFGADHPRVKSLNKKIESLQEFLKNQTGEVPNPGNQVGKVDETLIALRLELDEVKERFGTSHPSVKSLNSRIEFWSEYSKKQEAENKDADKKLSTQEQVSRLRDKFQTEVELNSERLTELSERSKEHVREVGDQVEIQKRMQSLQREFERGNDIFKAVATSRQFIEAFAKKYISLFDGDDASLVATQLASQMVVKRDELGQPNVFQIKLNNESALLGKGLIKLWVNELKSVLKGTGKVERTKRSLVELKKRQFVTQVRISALEAKKDEIGNSARLAESQRDLSVLDERIQRLTEFIEQLRSQHPQVEIQVLETSWTLSKDETKEYDKLRTQYPLLPKLEN